MIRTVDQAKCIGCGTCQRSCPLDVFRLDMKASVSSPCIAACPIGNNVREIHYLLETGRAHDAAVMMLAENPLASVTGRVCPHFCETECTRNQVDASVNISAIEQFLGDFTLSEKVERYARRHVAQVAVVGSGPAGLSCAYFLTLDGFQVTLFEAMDEPGGMLRYGIPEYRLPNPILSSFVERLRRMGVLMNCSQGLNKTFTLSDLLDRGFGAVFLGLGSGKPKKLQVEGMDAQGVVYGIDFLKEIRTGHMSKIAPRVAVVGGGDVAMDAALSALRLGSQSVTIISLEDEQHLPAYPHNIESARAEGIDFICSFGVKTILHKEGKISGLDLMKCIRVFNDQGVFSPMFDRGVTREMEMDMVILAIGQETGLFPLPREIVGAEGLIKTASHSCQTMNPKVFAAGDAVTGPKSVAHAVYGGKRAAKAISLFLRGIDLETLPPKEIMITDRLPDQAHLRKAVRHEKTRVCAGDGKGFSELNRGFDLIETLAEADRCLVCGAKSVAAHLEDCMTCFSCELNCPSNAIFVHPFKEILPRTLRPIEA